MTTSCLNCINASWDRKSIDAGTPVGRCIASLPQVPDGVRYMDATQMTSQTGADCETWALAHTCSTCEFCIEHRCTADISRLEIPVVANLQHVDLVPLVDGTSCRWWKKL